MPITVTMLSIIGNLTIILISILAAAYHFIATKHHTASSTGGNLDTYCKEEKNEDAIGYLIIATIAVLALAMTVFRGMFLQRRETPITHHSRYLLWCFLLPNDFCVPFLIPLIALPPSRGTSTPAT